MGDYREKPKTKKVITNSLEETQKLAKDLISDIIKKRAICLYGQLGSGKTAFIQGLGQALGVEKRMPSPTFIFIRKYHINKGKYRTFCHLDLYRLEKEQEAANIGLLEILGSDENVIAIEWAEKIPSLLPPKRTDIYIKNLGKNKREITIFNKL